MKASHALTRKISRLLYASPGLPTGNPVGSVPLQPLIYRRRLPRRSAGAVKDGTARFGEAPLTDLVEGRVVTAPSKGPVYLVEARASAPSTRPPMAPRDLLFFDIETTGLGSTPLFLIGVMAWEGDLLLVRQYLARDYSEEAAAISLFKAEADGKSHLVSFNGKSYDLPYIRTRAAATGVPFSVSLPHFDLLHESRRAWGGDLPNYRLATLERHVLGRPRHDDIPGAEIPDAYHAFVRTGDATQIARIIDHNRQDLVSMAELLVRLPE